jgi:hypothetical protein
MEAIMERIVTVVIPEAPIGIASGAPALSGQPHVEGRKVRLGLLNNNKGNADHLLRIIGERLSGSLAAESQLFMRKESAGFQAPDNIISKLANEADFVVTAMAD